MEPVARPDRSIDELAASIGRLTRQMNAKTYQLLLVREFDDRFGWSKWSFDNCAEWLAWRGEARAEYRVSAWHARPLAGAAGARPIAYS